MQTLKQIRSNRNRHLLPEPLDGDTHFTWGPVVGLHKIPAMNIIIVEYKGQIYEPGPTGKYHDESTFHLHGTSGSFENLESAIIFGIAKHNNVCDSFARASCRLLEIEDK